MAVRPQPQPAILHQTRRRARHEPAPAACPAASDSNCGCDWLKVRATSSFSASQQAAGGVDEPPAGFEQTWLRSPGWRCLPLSQFGDSGLGVWRHFRSGLRRSVPRPGTRRVDQHPVDLAGQALDALVALVGDLHRVHVGQAAARQARLERLAAGGPRCRRHRAGRCCASPRRAPASCRRRRRRSRPPSRRAWRRSAGRPAIGCLRPAPRTTPSRKACVALSAGRPSTRRPQGDTA